MNDAVQTTCGSHSFFIFPASSKPLGSANSSPCLLKEHPLPSLNNQTKDQDLVGGFSQHTFFGAPSEAAVTDDDLSDFAPGGNGFSGIRFDQSGEDSVLPLVAEQYNQQFPNHQDLLQQLARLAQHHQQNSSGGRPPLVPKHSNRQPRPRKTSKNDEDETSERPTGDKNLFTPTNNLKQKQRRDSQRSASSSSFSGSSTSTAAPTPDSDIRPRNFCETIHISGGSAQTMSGPRQTRNSKRAGGHDDLDGSELLPNNHEGRSKSSKKSDKVPRKKAQSGSKSAAVAAEDDDFAFFRSQNAPNLKLITEFGQLTAHQESQGKLTPDLLQEKKRLLFQMQHQIEQDKKANQEDRLKSLSKARETLATAQLELYFLRGVCRVNAQLAKKNETLEQQVTSLSRRVSKMRKARLAVATVVCKKELERIQKTFNLDIYPHVKFIFDKEDEMMVAKMVFTAMGYDKDVQDRDSWCKTYGKDIADFVATARNYLTQELKKVCFKRLRAGEDIPSAKDLLKCAKRDIDMSNPVESKLFKWYWVEVMAKVFGIDWSRVNCFYTTISAFENEKQEPANSPENEAMAALIWENNVDDWPNQQKFKDNPINKGKTYKNTGGLYTSTTSGQSEYTTWSAEGLEQFNVYTAEIRKAWVSPQP